MTNYYLNLSFHLSMNELLNANVTILSFKLRNFQLPVTKKKKKITFFLFYNAEEDSERHEFII